MREFIRGAALVCALALTAGAASATEGTRNDPNAENTTLSIEGVNFTDTREIEALYAKLNRAAERVCAVQDKSTLSVVRETEACQQRALDWAIQDINKASLTAYHKGDASDYAAAN